MLNSLEAFKGELGLTRAKHLLRRSTFVFDITTIKKFSSLHASDAVDLLFEFDEKYATEPIDPVTGQPFIDLYRGKPFKRRRNKGSKIGRLLKYTVGWWINEAIQDCSIKSKLVFFLHTCFSVNYGQSKGIFPNHFFDHLQLLSSYANKSYKELAYEMVVDNTMLEYLDNYTNSKDNPNENFAREFLELFTIGKGDQIGDGNYSTYTEKDVITAAKLLTGFVKGPKKINSDKQFSDIVIKRTPCRGGLNFGKHDISNKKFSQAFENTVIDGAVSKKDMWRELNDFVEMVFAQRATALNICRKVYRFFVFRTITAEVEQNIIEPLASLLIKNNFVLTPVIKMLLKSEHFLGSSNVVDTPTYVGSIIKSPLDLSLSLLTFFKVKTPNPELQPMSYFESWYISGLLERVLIASGFHPFAPQDVAGYPSYYQSPNFNRGWFSSSSIIGRYSFIEELIKEKENDMDFGGVSINIVDFVKANFDNPEDGQKLLTQITNLIFPLPPEKDRFDHFLNNVLLDNLSLRNWENEWKDFEKTNDKSGIERPLNRLLVALVNSPEFQVL